MGDLFCSEQLRGCSSVQDKLIVDLVNGLAVMDDHGRLSKKRSAFFQRFLDDLNGKSHARQDELNTLTKKGLSSALDLIMDLTRGATLGNKAILELRKSMTQVEVNVANMAEILSCVGHEVSDIRVEVEKLSVGLSGLILEHRAQTHMNAVLAAWSAGSFSWLPPLSRPFICLQELYWGDFGVCLSQKKDFDLTGKRLITTLRDMIVSQMRHDARELGVANERLPLDMWTQSANSSKVEINAAHDRELISFMGEWATPNQHPFSYAASQLPDVRNMPLEVPRLVAVDRFAKSMLLEHFPGSPA